MSSSPHALMLRERGTPVQRRRFLPPLAAGAAIVLALLSPACDDEHKDAYFGTDAGADYRLPPSLDARSDGNTDQLSGDGADAGDSSDAGDDVRETGAVDRASDAVETGGGSTDVASPPDAAVALADLAPDLAPADLPPADISSDLSSDLASVDLAIDTVNDASPG